MRDSIVRLEKAAKAFATPEGQTVTALDAIGFAPTDFDSLVTATGLTAAAISSMLMSLELDGHVADLGGGRYQRLAR